MICFGYAHLVGSASDRVRPTGDVQAETFTRTFERPLPKQATYHFTLAARRVRTFSSTVLAIRGAPPSLTE
jgi:hypothetical protein